MTTSFLVTPSELIDVDDDAQMRAIAEQFLVPMLNAGVGGGGRRQA